MFGLNWGWITSLSRQIVVPNIKRQRKHFCTSMNAWLVIFFFKEPVVGYDVAIAAAAYRGKQVDWVSSDIRTPPHHSPQPCVDALEIFWPWLWPPPPPQRLWSLMGLCIKSCLGTPQRRGRGGRGDCGNVGQEDATSGTLNLLITKGGTNPW